MAYDRDGTQVYAWTGTNAPGQLTAAQIQNLNDESGSTQGWSQASGVTGYLMFMFPEPRDLTAIFLAGGAYWQAIKAFQISTDTTNGIDGTWTSLAIPAWNTNSPTAMRTDIQAVSGATAIKALRINLANSGGGSLTSYIYIAHLYGQRSAVTDRLEFWHPTLDQSLNVTPAWFDWGDRPRSTVATKQFRIKNRSSTLTASTITVGMEALSDASPAYVGQHSFSLDGTTFASTVTIPSLAPGATSQPITVQQSLTATAILSLWWQRIYANAGSWA